MNQTPALAQTLTLNLASAPSWFGDPLLNGTIKLGATFTFAMPRTIGLNLNVTYRLFATNPDVGNEQVLGEVVRGGLDLGFGP